MPAQPPTEDENGSSAADPIPAAIRELLQSPSLFGRLLLIADFRGASAEGTKQAADLADNTEMQRAVERLHMKVFADWLTLSLERQTADLRVFLNLGGTGSRSGNIRQLTVQGERAIPAGVKSPERQLFLQDLKIVQSLLNYEG